MIEFREVCSSKRTVDVSAVLVYHLLRRDVLSPRSDISREIRNRNGVVVAFERVDDIGGPDDQSDFREDQLEDENQAIPQLSPGESATTR